MAQTILLPSTLPTIVLLRLDFVLYFFGNKSEYKYPTRRWRILKVSEYHLHYGEPLSNHCSKPSAIRTDTEINKFFSLSTMNG